MILKIFFVAMLASFATAEIHLTDCAPGTPNAPAKNNIKMTLLAITGCTVEPCVFIKGDNYSIEIKGTFGYTATTMMVTATVLLPGNIPLDLINQDWCSNIRTGNCKDIKPGAELGGISAKVVDMALPDYTGPIRLFIKDDDKKNQYCGELKIVVKGKGDGKGGVGGLLGG